MRGGRFGWREGTFFDGAFEFAFSSAAMPLPGLMSGGRLDDRHIYDEYLDLPVIVLERWINLIDENNALFIFVVS